MLGQEGLDARPPLTCPLGRGRRVEVRLQLRPWPGTSEEQAALRVGVGGGQLDLEFWGLQTLLRVTLASVPTGGG